MVITSQDNRQIVFACKLKDKRFRKETGLYLIEGERLVADALRYNAPIQTVFLRESTAHKYDYENAIVVSDRVFSKLEDTVSSQGVVAVVKKVENPLLASQGNCLILDGLQDPGNVGTLIRCAAACGFEDIYLCGSVDAYSPKVLRSAMSAHFCTRLHFCTVEEAFALCNRHTTVAADMDGENLFCTEVSGNVAVVLGNEGNGLSDFSRNNATVKVSLPMKNGFESLNVAVAGSVMMYTFFGRSFHK